MSAFDTAGQLALRATQRSLTQWTTGLGSREFPHETSIPLCVCAFDCCGEPYSIPDRWQIGHTHVGRRAFQGVDPAWLEGAE